MDLSKVLPYFEGAAVWLKGLLAAIVGGASTAILAGVSDPNNFNIATPDGWARVKVVAINSAAVSALLYLKAPPVAAPPAASTDAKPAATA